ncbi:hypothetical protein U9M48_041112 [Paspalum notatum var. saurae]|uniref:Reverse transcriptase zinc-binding domain-containing protein n=1 Tax=Paspalum notatum var. saurae TaxID=547442 RepID=A0AAQ3URW6_PASNO
MVIRANGHHARLPVAFPRATDPLQCVREPMDPDGSNMVTLKRLLELFGQASGLTTNFHKSTVIPIRCNGINLQSVLEGFPARRAAFPIKYLGLPLTNTRLCKMDFQFLVDKILAKLNSWNGRNLTVAGRLTLVKSVITPQTVYLLTAFKAPAGVLELIDLKRRQFLWSGIERPTGGKCKVNWFRSARPKALGGLGILNIVSFARALHLRWLWQAWARQDRPGPDGDGPCTETDKLFFAAATSIHVGDGKLASFWDTAWLRGLRPRDFAPHDRVWTGNRLARRGWPHSPVCVLCRLTQESGLHLFCECRFSKRIWAEVAHWAAVQHLEPSTWGHYDSVLQWWSSLSEAPIDSGLGLGA